MEAGPDNIRSDGSCGDFAFREAVWALGET